MPVSTKKLGTLYQNGIAVNFATAPIAYISDANSSAILELKSSSSNTNEVIEWLVIEDGAKHYLLSTKNLLSNISYNALNIQALVSGNTLVTLDDVKYKLRLISTDEYNRYVLNQINLNTLLTPTLLDMTVGGYTDTTISSSETNNLLHWYKSPTLTQSLSSDSVIVRGGDSIDTSNTIAKSTLSNYRIFLEKYNNPPSISEYDRMLGNFSANFSRTYSVIDPDNDLFTIVTKIDDTIIQTLTNQVSKTDFTLSLENNWNSLTTGLHTIYINVTDSYGNFVQRKWGFNKLASDIGTSNALVRPVITTDTNSSSSMYPIDGRIAHTISFTATGGELVIAHEFSITDNETQAEIYKRKEPSFDFRHTIPANVMTNGRIYQLKVRTYNQQDQYSNWSDTVLIKALTPPELIINTIINERIETGNPYFTATATFVEAEKDGIYSYEYNLYKDGAMIATSGELTDGKLACQFTNLENKQTYTIDLIVKTNYSMTTTLSQQFFCDYLQARLPAILEPINNPKTGSIDIKTYVRQIIGRVESGDKEYYIDGDWVYLHNTVLIYDSDGAFRLKGNWTAKIWARDLEDNGVMLLQFNTEEENSKIVLTRNGNVFTLSKIVSGIILYELHRVVRGDIFETDVLYFFIQNNVDVGLMNFDVKRVTTGRLSWFTPTHSEDVAPIYQVEDGFLTQVNSKLLSKILPKTIDGQDSRIYLPSADDFNLDIFKAVYPSQDTENDYNIKIADVQFGVIGTAKIGETKIYSSSFLPYGTIDSSTIGGAIIFDPKTACNVRTRNLYSGLEAFKIKYKVQLLGFGDTTVVEKLDGLAFKFRSDIKNDTDYIIDLTSIWNQLTYGNHTVDIITNNGKYQLTKTLNFTKAYNSYSVDFDGNKLKTLTRSIDSTDNTKLIAIDENGAKISLYPNEINGIRIMMELSFSAQVTLYPDLYDNCYIFNNLLTPIFTTKTVDKLNIGDKIKDFSTHYNGNLLKFTVINKLSDRLILICDNAICSKCYDESEATLINGNPDWNLSNIKQWLNNSVRIG